METTELQQHPMAMVTSPLWKERHRVPVPVAEQEVGDICTTPLCHRITDVWHGI